MGLFTKKGTGNWDKKEYVLGVVKQDDLILQRVTKEFRNNPEIVMEAVKQNGVNLYCASEELRNNPEIVMEAVKQNGLSLYCASDELKNDKKIVLEAVKQNRSAFYNASENIKNLVGDNNPIEVLEFEIGKEKSTLMANNFRASIEELDLSTLPAEVKNDMTSETQLANKPTTPHRRLKL